MGLFWGKKIQPTNGTYGPPKTQRDYTLADKVQLAKNTHKYYGIVPWGMSFLFEQENQPLREARYLLRNQEEQNAFVDAILTKAANNVVGSSGFVLQAGTSDPAFNAQVEKLWKRWTREADSVGNTWCKHQEIQVRGVFRDGDCGCVNFYSLPNPDTGEPFGIDQVVPFEATDLMTPPNVEPHEKGSRIVDGIEYNAIGAPTYFYIRTMPGLGAIPAAHVAFFKNVQKMSNSRGIPALMPSIGVLENLNGLAEAEVYASRLNATTVYHQHHKRAPKTNPNETSPAVSAPAPGEVVHTYGEDEFNVLSSNHPNPNFKDAFILFARIASLPLFLPIEQVLCYFAESNYSSNRAALLETQRSFERFQREFANAYLSRIYRWKLIQWVSEGKLIIPQGLDLEDLFEHRFVGPKFAYLDAIKEAQAHQILVDVGMETQRSLLASHGKDFDDWVKGRAAEIAAMKAAGIPVFHHTSMVPVDEKPAENPEGQIPDQDPTDGKPDKGEGDTTDD